MRDFEKLVKKLRYCSKPGNCNLQCPRFSFAEDCLGKLTTDAADAIEELLAFAYAVAKMAVNAEDDEVSAEVLCRKLYKLGIIEKDGAWWWLPAPPKGVE